MLISAFFLSISLEGMAGYGFDAGQSLQDYTQLLSKGDLSGKNGTWVRMRGLAGSGGEGGGPPERLAADREALAALHRSGVRVCVILRWDSSEWKTGVRAGGGHRLPLDLREAFERTRRLGAAYGDLVDAWEIENEPDIGFVAENPEVMAAFLKACCFGLKAGAVGRAASLSPSPSLIDGPAVRPCLQSTWRAQKRGVSSFPDSQLSTLSSPHVPRVLMPPLALPPGPYFEQLWANGIASYTDGFNYHYYGYAEDFMGVYRQFEDAVTGGDGASGLSQRKMMPVFLTEYGYGLLDGVARDTTEGRVRQWRWFADVAGQIQTLRPEGPMAFVLNPYFEADLAEFGLLMKDRVGMSEGWKNRGEPSAERQESRGQNQLSGQNSQFPVFGARLNFTPSDFDVATIEPWMTRIGLPLGDAYTSPALGYLQDYAVRHPYKTRDWKLRASVPSPVVIDFIAGDDMRQLKDYGGYWLKGSGSGESEGRHADSEGPASGFSRLLNTPHPTLPAIPSRTGHGRIVLYNFSDRPVAGALMGFPSYLLTARGATDVLTLAPGERREFYLQLVVPEDVFSGHSLRMTFTSSQVGVPPSVYATILYPDGDQMVNWHLADFNFPSDAAQAARTMLLARPLAREEPPLQQDGRWLASDGVKVTEANGVWRFNVSRFPSQSLRPAMVELPLPAGFVFRSDTMLLFNYRKGEDSKEIFGPAADSRCRTRSGRWGDLFDFYIRTANGNLYQGSPRLKPGESWANYGQCAQNFTMGFFGRAALPWRFSDNQPVSLVFFLRPAKLPFTLEVKQTEIVRFTHP